MDTQLEKAVSSDRNAPIDNAAPKPEGVVDEVENVSIDGPKTYAIKGDDSDGHVTWTVKSRIAACGLGLVYVGSQIPLYSIGGTLSFITEDLGGGNSIAWLPVSYSLTLAATCPFLGYVQDMVGRRYIALAGAFLMCLGIAIIGGSKTLAQAIVGAAIAGIGAGINELTSLAGVSELVPVNRRGTFLAYLVAVSVPFSPFVLYAQYFSTYATWRWGMWIALIINGTGGILLALTYFPQRRSDSGLSKKEILKRIDYVGAVLSISGLTLFLLALQSGGYDHPWKSASILCPLIIGLLLLAAFVAWEWKGAKYPVVPKQIFAGQRIVGLCFAIAFISGMNFYALLNFYPLEYTDVFEPTPYAIGTKSLGVAFGTPLGAMLVNSLLSKFKNHNRELLLVSCIIMTAFGGAMAAVNPDRPAMAVAFSAIGGFGVGGVLIPAATVAITVTPDAFIATTVALSVAIRVIGGTIGYSIYYNVFANKLKATIPLQVGEAALKAGLPFSSAVQFVIAFLTAPDTVNKVPGITPEILNAAQIASRWAYSEALSYVWYMSIPFGVLAIIGCLFLGNVRPYLTHRVAAELK